MITIHEVEDCNFIPSIMQKYDDKPSGIGDLKLHNGVVKMNIRALLFHKMLWKPYFEFNKPIEASDIYFDGISSLISCQASEISKIQTSQKEILLDLDIGGTLDISKLGMCMFRVIDEIHQFEYIYCQPYNKSLSGQSFYEISKDPKIKELIDTKYNHDEGTAVAEVKLRKNGERLKKLLTQRGLMKNNVLRDFAETGCFNFNQLPQMLLAYGTRDDVDTKMSRYIISNSAIQGLRTINDFATESLASKKAACANASSVSQVQYSARKLKLACLVLDKIYPGDCGSTVTITITPKPEHLDRYIYKTVRVAGVEHNITKDNYKEFIGKELVMRTPMGCRHTDGICDACTGFRNGKFSKWIPDGIQLGLFTGSLSSSIIAQTVLSTKHLIKTFSDRFKLSDSAAAVFDVEAPDKIYLNKLTVLDDLTMEFPVTDMGPLVDLYHGDAISNISEYSKISEVLFTYGDEKRHVSLSDGSAASIYLSSQMLMYMKKLKVKASDGVIRVDLRNWSIRNPIFQYTLYNDDMSARARKFENYLMKQIRTCTSLSHALEKYSELVYSKLNIPIVYLEMILRVFLVESAMDATIPTRIENPDNVMFLGLKDVIKGRSITMKLAYEDNLRYISDPGVFNITRPDGLYDPLFGIIDEDI